MIIFTHAFPELAVADLDAVYAAWTQAGVTILDPIATRTWGMREFPARDLDGNELRGGHLDEGQANYADFEGRGVD